MEDSDLKLLNSLRTELAELKDEQKALQTQLERQPLEARIHELESQLATEEPQPIHRNGNGTWTMTNKVMVSIIGFLITGLILWVATIFTWTVEIRANRFTSSDATEMRRSIESRIPPPEVVRRLERLEADVDRLKLP